MSADVALGLRITLCILLAAWGHIFRDGWPATGSTHLARFGGAVWCLGAAMAVSPNWRGASMASAVWIGFYFDQKHGEGQGADNWRSIGFLALSGVTSILPLVLSQSVAIWGGFQESAAFMDRHWLIVAVNLGAAAMLVAGLAKPPIWLLCWAHLREQRGWFLPTRVAAGIFGAVVGALFAAYAR